MFSVKLPDHTHIVTFQHERHGLPDRRTMCQVITVFDNGDAPRISLGFARCSESDNFRRATGRQLAFSRALAKARLSQVDLNLVCDEYNRRHRS